MPCSRRCCQSLAYRCCPRVPRPGLASVRLQDRVQSYVLTWSASALFGNRFRNCRVGLVSPISWRRLRRSREDRAKLSKRQTTRVSPLLSFAITLASPRRSDLPPPLIFSWNEATFGGATDEVRGARSFALSDATTEAWILDPLEVLIAILWQSRTTWSAVKTCPEAETKNPVPTTGSSPSDCARDGWTR